MSRFAEVSQGLLGWRATLSKLFPPYDARGGSRRELAIKIVETVESCVVLFFDTVDADIGVVFHVKN